MRLAKRPHSPAAGGVRANLRPHLKTIAARRIDRSRAVTLSSSRAVTLGSKEFGASSEVIQESVPGDQVVQAELSFATSDQSVQNARQVVAQAFADIDIKGAESLTASDLLAADNRAKEGPSRISWMQVIWTTFKRAITGVGRGVER